MTWFRVDDNFHAHPKRLRASRSALGLWAVAGSWSGAYLTEGFIPNDIVRNLGFTRADARSLVESGLWTTEDGGYRFHEWEQRNPTAEKASDLREKRAAAGRKGGLKSGETRSKREASASSTDEAKTNPVPSRPVPSREPLSTHLPTLGLVSRLVTRGRTTTATDDDIALWQGWAGPDVDLIAECKAFLLHNAETDLTNPRAALKGWLERARTHAAQPAPRAPQPVGFRPTPVPSRPTCQRHEGQPLPPACPDCAREKATPPPGWRALADPTDNPSTEEEPPRRPPNPGTTPDRPQTPP